MIAPPSSVSDQTGSPARAGVVESRFFAIRHEHAAWWQYSFIVALQTSRSSRVPLPRQTADGLATAV